MNSTDHIRLTSEPLKINCLFAYLNELSLGNASPAAVEEVLLLFWDEVDKAIEVCGPNQAAIIEYLLERMEYETDDILVRDWDRQEVADLVDAGMLKYRKMRGLERLDHATRDELLSEVRWRLERLAMDGEIDDLDEAVEHASREAYVALDETSPDVMRRARTSIPA